MIQPLPKDITKISSPLISFCGDESLSLFIADRFFRDGSTHYDIEIISDQDITKSLEMENQQKEQGKHIMKGSWYNKHSHKQPALCLFCISIDLIQLVHEREKWLQDISKQFSRVSNQYSSKKPAFLSIFVCPGNRESLLPNGIREDGLIRDLNSLAVEHLHSFLFYEEDLIGSALSSIKSLKAEVYQICHNYYSDRLDVLDSDMQASQSDISPEQTIRMMLKMSFFNECLSSLTLQNSNATYGYNRCLEYYSRVQDYCLSLFVDIDQSHNEEMRQILSIVNYKIILYSFLLQQAKGIVSLTKKITTCIDTTSQIFHDDTSALFSLWKAAQYQYIIDEFTKLQESPGLELKDSLDFCYFYRFYYVREAFVLSLEYSLSSSLSPAGEEKKDVPSNSLFLSLHYYESEEVYMNYRMNEFDFCSLYSACSNYNKQHSIPVLTQSDLFDAIDVMLTHMNLLPDEEETKMITTFIQNQTYSSLKMFLLVVCYVCHHHHLQTKFVQSLLLLSSSHINLSQASRILFFNFCTNTSVLPPPSHWLVPVEWCVLSHTWRTFDNQLLQAKLVVKNPFPSAITIHHVQLDGASQAAQVTIPSQSTECVSVSLTADQIQSLPSFTLQLKEFSSPCSLSPLFCTLSKTRWNFDHIEITKVQVLNAETPPILCVPLEEVITVGKVNEVELPFQSTQRSALAIQVSCEDSAFEEVIHYPRELLSIADRFILEVDLRDSKWFTKSEFYSITITLRTGEITQTKALLMRLARPFSCSFECIPIRGTYYSLYQINGTLTLHCFHENVVIQQVVCRGNRDAITKCNSDISENQLLDINEDYTWDFSIRIPYEYEGDLHGCSFIIEYTLNKTHCSYQLDIPVLHLQKPPIVYSVELESSLVKGTPSNGSITIHNQSTSIQHIQFVLNKGFTKWVINGVMDCDYTIFPGDVVHHPFTLIPIQAGSQDYSLVSLYISNLDIQIEDFFPPKHVYVKDSDCIL